MYHFCYTICANFVIPFVLILLYHLSQFYYTICTLTDEFCISATSKILVLMR